LHELSSARGGFHVMPGIAYVIFHTFPTAGYMYPFVVRYDRDVVGR
jgi:hypothetical protein